MKKEKATLIKPKKEGERNNSKLLSAILTLVLGIILFTDSSKAVIIVFYCIGVVFLLVGIFHFISYYKTKKELHIEDNNKLILATSALFIGIVILILSSAIEKFLRFILGIILIFNGLRNIVVSLQIKNYVPILIGIVFVGMGLYTILAENIVLQIVGALFILSSIVDFVSMFTSLKK